MGSDATRRRRAEALLPSLAWVGDADVWVRFPSGRVRGPLKAAAAAYTIAGNPAATVHARPSPFPGEPTEDET